MQTLSDFIQPFFEWLLRSTLQASVVIGLILVIQIVLRNRLTARWHYALWLILVVRMVLPWSPQSRFSVYNLAARENKTAAPTHVMTDQDAESLTVSRQHADTQQTAAGSKPAGAAERQGRILQDPIGTSGGYIDSAARAEFAMVSVLPFIWLGGMLFLGGYIVISNLRLWRAASVERPSTDKDTLELLEECRTAIGLRTIVALIPSEAVNTPILLGFVRPRLLVPKNISKKLTRDELRYIFLHELAHVKRNDIAFGWLTALLQVLHWFNPLVWLAFHRMRSNRESACDALVLSRTQGEAAQDYGLAIVSLLEHFSVPQALPGLAGILESKSQLKRRIAMITQFKHNSYHFSPLAVVLIAILACISLPDAERTKASVASAPVPSVGMTVRKVWEGLDVDNCGKISPDGKYLSYVDWGTGDLAVYEIATGKKRHLTNKGPWKESDEFADFNRWSPDSRQIVYAWYNQNRPQSGELRVIDADGSAEPRILFSDESYQWISPCDWSKDGKLILTWPQKKDGSELAVISVADGSIRVLKKFAKGRFNNAIFSPEGDDIVYDDLNGDIIMLSVKSGEERTLVNHPANDSVMGWGADGKHLLFTSDRSGFPEIWAVKVDAGKALDDPWLVKSGMGVEPPRALGTTTAGLFYYSTFPRQTDVYVTEIDPGSGNVVSQPREAINYFVGSNATPDYSPDGKYMAYIRKSGSVANLLCIRSLETGEERSFRPSGLDVFGFPRWSPDGRSLLVIATGGINIRTKNGEMGLYTVNAQTGESELIVKTERPQRLHDHAWGTDEKSVVFVRSTNLEDVNSYTNTEIVQRVIAGGKETSLRSGTLEDIYSISRSPHGRWLAFLGNRKKRNLRVMPLTGGEPRVVYTFDQGDNSDIPHAWSVDGKYILIPQLRETQGNQREWDLCRIAVEDGKSQNLGLEIPGFQSLSTHPDGRHIAFSGQPANYTKPTIWVMENFLPKTLAATPRHQPHFRKIQIPYDASRLRDAQLSPDGKSIAFVLDHKLWVMLRVGKLGPDIPGAPRLLDTGDIELAWQGLAWSGDGRRIAFHGKDELNEEEKRWGNRGVYVISVDGGKPKEVYEKWRYGDWIVNYRMSLSANGKTLAFSCVDANEQHIYTIGVDGGVPRRLLEDPAREPVFSPDGKRIAYVADKNRGAKGGGLWVVSAEGGTPTLIADAGNATSPVWSPDGRMIAFLDQTMAKQIFIVPIGKDGKPAGEKITIDCPEGVDSVRRLTGWTPDDKLGTVFAGQGQYGLYTLPATGGIVTLAAHGGDSLSQPRWSGDGRQIIVTVAAGEGRDGWKRNGLASISAEGGEISTIPIRADSPVIKLSYGGGNHVSPDGKTIVFAGRKEDQKEWWFNHIWTLPIEGGQPKQLTDAPAPLTDWYPCWSPDGKAIAFIRSKTDLTEFNTIETDIFIVPADGGEPRRLTGESDEVLFGYIAWSPDGKWLSYFSADKESPGFEVALKVVPSEGGPSCIVGQLKQKGFDIRMESAWSADSKRIAFIGTDYKVIKIMSLDDGSVMEVDPHLSDTNIWHLDWSRNGDRLAFSGRQGGGLGFWTMENFLTSTAIAGSSR